ncbi:MULTISPECIES: transcriptional regulator [Streptomycetaceae]|uniref:transcriptional regulator n=1 Tax=Streptomycetaceae TaxID=2062 RepID=UPI00036D044F|nr:MULTISPECIES: transcriptional regulator [Streptomycetaceae]
MNAAAPPPETEDLSSLIQWIKDTTRDSSDSAISRRIGVSPATVNSWVRGTRGAGRGPNRAALQRLAAEYAIPEDRVFAAAGRRTPGPLSPDAKERLLALFEELTEEQQRIKEIELKALADANRQAGDVN